MNNDKLISSLENLYTELIGAKDLAAESLLRSKELIELDKRVGSRLDALRQIFSDEWQRKYDKQVRGRWKSEIIGGFANAKNYDEYVGYFEIFIAEFIEHLTSIPPKREDYISTGKPFDARTRLRAIFKQAEKEIVLVDNFLHPDLLAVLQTFLEEKSAISLKFLTRKSRNSNFKSFASDLKQFLLQYSNRSIEAKECVECHDRFIIIDGTNVYHSGHSFHDLGNKAGRISKIESSDEIAKFIADYSNWWGKGTIIPLVQ